MENLKNYRKIKAKFSGKCAATGASIKKGEECFFDLITRRIYKIEAVYYMEKITGTDDRDPAAGMIQGNEDAFFDNFCQQNNI